MNKSELIKRVSEHSQTPQIQVKNILDATIEAICESLTQTEEVNIAGFGKFYTVECSGRSVTLPTGETIETQTKRMPRFKSGSTLKSLVSGTA